MAGSSAMGNSSDCSYWTPQHLHQKDRSESPCGWLGSLRPAKASHSMPRQYIDMQTALEFFNWKRLYQPSSWIGRPSRCTCGRLLSLYVLSSHLFAGYPQDIASLSKSTSNRAVAQGPERPLSLSVQLQPAFDFGLLCISL